MTYLSECGHILNITFRFKFLDFDWFDSMNIYVDIVMIDLICVGHVWIRNDYVNVMLQKYGGKSKYMFLMLDL